MCVVRFVTDNDEILNTPLRLNIAEEWFNDVDKVQSCNLIVKLEQDVLSSGSDCLLKVDEQAANIDSVECRCSTKSSLITKEDDASAR